MAAIKTNDRIYIVISQTGTILSRVLKRITGSEYNHVSIGLKPDLHEMYSFGRKQPYNPFWAGFVVESPEWGTFKRFSNTKVIVLALDIDTDKYNEISNLLQSMSRHKNRYHYNYIGLVLAYFKIHKTSYNRYYCSEFLKYVLQQFSIEGSDKLEAIVQPMHFLNIPNTEEIFCGRLSDYVSSYNFNTVK